MSILCQWFGHKPVAGPIKRSPMRSYTHFQNTSCKRCGLIVKAEKFYFDKTANPEMFNIVSGVDMDVLGYREPWAR